MMVVNIANRQLNLTVFSEPSALTVLFLPVKPWLLPAVSPPLSVYLLVSFGSFGEDRLNVVHVVNRVGHEELDVVT